jgi:hypothetical protein
VRNYPLGRWSLSDTSVGASVWTKEVPEGEGGGYYLYTWKRGADAVTVEELVEGTTKQERGRDKRSEYVHVGEIPVPPMDSTRRDRDLAVARLIYKDMGDRFDSIAEWIPYGTDGRPVWFHDTVTG